MDIHFCCHKQITSCNSGSSSVVCVSLGRIICQCHCCVTRPSQECVHFLRQRVYLHQWPFSAICQCKEWKLLVARLGVFYGRPRFAGSDHYVWRKLCLPEGKQNLQDFYSDWEFRPARKLFHLHEELFSCISLLCWTLWNQPWNRFFSSLAHDSANIISEPGCAGKQQIQICSNPVCKFQNKIFIAKGSGSKDAVSEEEPLLPLCSPQTWGPKSISNQKVMMCFAWHKIRDRWQTGRFWQRRINGKYVENVLKVFPWGTGNLVWA